MKNRQINCLALKHFSPGLLSNTGLDIFAFQNIIFGQTYNMPVLLQLFV